MLERLIRVVADEKHGPNRDHRDEPEDKPIFERALAALVEQKGHIGSVTHFSVRKLRELGEWEHTMVQQCLWSPIQGPAALKSVNEFLHEAANGLGSRR